MKRNDDENEKMHAERWWKLSVKNVEGFPNGKTYTKLMWIFMRAKQNQLIHNIYRKFKRNFVCYNSHKRVVAHINTQLFIVCTIFHLSRVFIRKSKTVSSAISSTLISDQHWKMIRSFFFFYSSLAMIIFHHRRTKTWVCRARTNGPVWAKKANWARHTAAKKKKRETRTTCGSRENSKYEIEERKKNMWATHHIQLSFNS